MFAIQLVIPAILNWSPNYAPDTVWVAPFCCLAMVPYLMEPKLRACRLISRFAYLAFISLFLFDLASLWIYLSRPGMLLSFALIISPTLLFGHLVFRNQL